MPCRAAARALRTSRWRIARVMRTDRAERLLSHTKAPALPPSAYRTPPRVAADEEVAPAEAPQEAPPAAAAAPPAVHKLPSPRPKSVPTATREDNSAVAKR